MAYIFEYKQKTNLEQTVKKLEHDIQRYKKTRNLP